MNAEKPIWKGERGRRRGVGKRGRRCVDGNIRESLRPSKRNQACFILELCSRSLLSISPPLVIKNMAFFGDS